MTDTPQWNDESIDARIRALAAEHNRPVGAVPRDAMWQAIAPAWQAARVATETPVPLATPVRRRFRPAPLYWSAALAAGLVLGVMLERRGLAPHAPVTVAVVPAGDRQPSTTPAPEPNGNSTTSVPSPEVTTSGTARRTAASSNGTNEANATGAADARPLYRAAARQTLMQAEALLTAYRSADDSHRDQESMQQAGRWARDVLSSTRLLLDSPAANDPQFRALFTDLELVLAQIVQLSGAPLQAGERELIERGMRDRDLLPRLRSALPAGAATS